MFAVERSHKIDAFGSKTIDSENVISFNSYRSGLATRGIICVF